MFFVLYDLQVYCGAYKFVMPSDFIFLLLSYQSCTLYCSLNFSLSPIQAHGNGHLVSRIVEKMIASLTQYSVVIDREAWIREAEDCEHSGAVLTCHAIIKNTIFLGELCFIVCTCSCNYICAECYRLICLTFCCGNFV